MKVTALETVDKEEGDVPGASPLLQECNITFMSALQCTAFIFFHELHYCFTAVFLMLKWRSQCTAVVREIAGKKEDKLMLTQWCNNSSFLSLSVLP